MKEGKCAWFAFLALKVFSISRFGWGRRFGEPATFFFIVKE